MAVKTQEIWRVPDEATYRGERILGAAEDLQFVGLIMAMKHLRDGVDDHVMERTLLRILDEYELDKEAVLEATHRILISLREDED